MCRLGHGSDLVQGSGDKRCEKFILRCLFGFIAALTEARQESLLSDSFDVPLMALYLAFVPYLLHLFLFLTYLVKKKKKNPKR